MNDPLACYTIETISEMDAESEWMIEARRRGVRRIIGTEPPVYRLGSSARVSGHDALQDVHPTSGESMLQILDRKDAEAREAIAPAMQMDSERQGRLPGLKTVEPDGTARARSVNPDNTLFTKLLTQLLNRCNWDSATNTPDFILAEMIVGQLTVHRATVLKNEEWHK